MAKKNITGKKSGEKTTEKYIVRRYIKKRMKSK